METASATAARQLDDVEAWALAIDGAAPRYMAVLRSVEELAEALREAAERGWAVAPRGGGSKLGLGNPPRSLDLALDLSELAGLVEYTPADMTVTVRAGTRLADLQGELAAHGQMLALDPPWSDRATVGGVLSTNDSGPRRLGYGTARDVVIGTRVAGLDGRVTRAGGKVVKNVTGYDLNKLYIGSLGTLAVLAEVSFKLHPLPAGTRTVAASFPDTASAMNAVLRLTRSPLGPIALALADGPPTFASPLTGTPGSASSDGLIRPVEGVPFQLYAELSGGTAALERKMGDALRFCREAGALDATLCDDAEDAWAALREHPSTLGAPDGVRLKMAVPPTALAGLIDAARARARADSLPCRVLAWAGSGVVYAYLGAGTVAQHAAIVRNLRTLAGGAGGSLVVEECPTALKTGIDVWGEAPAGLAVMRRLKQTYDPLGLLNPGRYVGGL